MDTLIIRDKNLIVRARLDHNIARVTRICQEIATERMQAYFRAMDVNSAHAEESMAHTLSVLKTMRDHWDPMLVDDPECVRHLLQMDVNIAAAEVLLDLVIANR